MNKTVKNFMIWLTKNTSSLQSNVRIYKNKYYFTDRDTVSGDDGALNDLWGEYLKDIGL